MVVEAAIDEAMQASMRPPSVKVPYTPMEASNNFHESKSTSTTFPWKLVEASMEVNYLHGGSKSTFVNFHGSKSTYNLLPWKLVEAFMEVGVNFHGSRSNGSWRVFMEALWKQLKV